MSKSFLLGRKPATQRKGVGKLKNWSYWKASQSNAKIKRTFCLMYIVYGNLSLCDILYIILSCIQTLSFNTKGSRPAFYLLLLFFLLCIFLNCIIASIKLNYFLSFQFCLCLFMLFEKLKKKLKDGFVHRVQYSNCILCFFFSPEHVKKDDINMLMQ